ncbi:hypothetical protein VRU48_05515 [Pedobacter sp. KR3-3]|uniref:Uncharacterized protein n=1 Tax=Pedobacter albus TaxID=3113905 RepID=A0ABU7I5E4_9SPHI|nr:hypothetical protein [Pedobacter sp. KR3-3]MEE1944556.1 hypothetical protein [Pedobacter sp. KR3-3]
MRPKRESNLEYFLQSNKDSHGLAEEPEEEPEALPAYIAGGYVNVFGQQYHLIRLDYCSARHKLALLHYKKDGYYYLTIIDTLEQQIANEFVLNLSFSKMITEYFPLYRARYPYHYPDYSPTNQYYTVNDGLTGKFRELEMLHFFKVDFDKGEVVLFGRVFSYDYRNSNLISEDRNFDEFSFERYGFDGGQQIQKTFKHKDIAYAAFSQNKLFVVNSGSFSDFNDLLVFWPETGEETFFELLNNDDLMEEKGFYYEYVEELVALGNTGRFGFIAENPTYGAMGVKIVEVLDGQTLKMYYDMDDVELEGAFRNLTFNYRLDEFVVLYYTYPGNMDIHVYAIHGEEKKPIQVIKTPYRHHDDNFNDAKYLNNEKLVIIKLDKIIIYHLPSAKLEKEIERDASSPYFVAENQIWYCFEGKLLVHHDAEVTAN